MSRSALIAECNHRFATQVDATCLGHEDGEEWCQLWTDPNPRTPEWTEIRNGARALNIAIPVDESRKAILGPLVGSLDVRTRPVHRWFTFKEAFSPDLLATLIRELGLRGPLNVIDVFGGVATTALAGQLDENINAVTSIEYSPFAQFVGATKLSWPELDPARLETMLKPALSYDAASGGPPPILSSFHNRRVFAPQTVRSLVSARDHVRRLDLSPAEKDFFLLGLAAVVEDLSGAMKDGRALRIKGNRTRRPTSLAATRPRTLANGRVKRALAGQWSAMIDDLELLEEDAALAARAHVAHLRGDARCLGAMQERPLVPDEWADLSCFSPPYLNCLDYTEVYKLELWLLEFVTTQDEFRAVREGTLRSHPSIRFESRPISDGVESPVLDHAAKLSRWMASKSVRREVARPLIEYFQDMLEVWKQQARVLKKRGIAACVVANSTFSRRSRDEDGNYLEEWRFPVLTDSLLASLALEAGFERVEIWPARDLRPRNTRSAAARESVVIAWR